MVQCTASLLAASTAAFLFASGVSGRGVPTLLPRTYCTNAKQVVADNTCETIADKRCTISLATFKSYNPQLDCANLRVGQNFCCNEGTVPRDPECTNSKTVVEGNTCKIIADERCTISLATFKTYNPQLDCSNLKVGQAFCCNAGSVPLPACTNIKTVVEGNTCATIADKRCTLSLSKFQDYNPSVDCSKLEVGTKVCCMEGKLPPLPQPNSDGTCSDRQVVAGDTCGTLYEKCGITPSLLTKYNPASNFCSGLRVNQWICCSSGKLKDRRPKNNADGSCATYTVKTNDSCSMIEAANGMDEGELATYNKRKTWGWAGCDKLWPNSKICLSSGTPPMPLPLDNAVCGPQKPGTVVPAAGTNISTLNPCPLNACCNLWGQCGTNKDFCAITGDGTPGTGTCISNCGMEIVNNNVAPSVYRKIGYFEAWNPERPCLWMDVSSIDESKFTHVHFAFADVTPDFRVDVSKVQDQFDKFKALKKAKRIVAFGGWTASTSKTTFQIFRDGVNSANRGTLATNIANFVKEHGLDGADIDWEYPAAPDLPKIPPADPIDGPNYLSFLKLLRTALPSGKSLSIAAPASYWYLKGFPIKDISAVVDYIVYMTYDLHGQWDAGSEWSQDGCLGGNCLRSHINMTETHNALVMITKAGVPSTKVIVGVTSYGRAFKMKDPNCRGPMCEYTGTANVSIALPGPCTGTKGYISNAEINEYINLDKLAKRDGLGKRDISVEYYYDKDTRSDIAILDGTYVAYMGAAEKAARSTIYQDLNMGGTSDWAHDLETFTVLERQSSGSLLSSRFTKKGVDNGDPIGTPHWYDLSCKMDEVDQADMDRKKRWDGVMADEAWADAIKAYVTRKRDTGSFSSWIIGKFFRGDQGLNCGTVLAASQCQIRQATCYDKDNKPPILTTNPVERTGPAGMFITNSFVRLEESFVNYYRAIRDARADVQGLDDTMLKTFITDKDDTFSKQLGWNILAVLTSVVSGPLFGNLLRNPVMENVANNVMLGIVASAKDKMTGSTEDENASKLQLALNATMTGWENAITTYAAELFSGSAEGNGNLQALMANGALIPGGVPVGSPQPEILNATIMKDMAKKAVFMYLIPEAWKLNEDSSVAILDTERSCGDTSSTTYVKSPTVKQVEVCYKNKQYLLLSAGEQFQSCWQNPGAPMPSCTHNDWDLPPGFVHLGEFGLDYKNIATAALTTWTMNGNKNGASFDPNRLALRNFYNSTKSMSTTEVLVDLGMVNIPVCKLSQANINWGLGGGKGDFYPCSADS